MKKIIFNHKSYLLYDEIVQYKNDFDKLDKSFEYILFPQLIYLSLFSGDKYVVGAQDFYSTNTGSFSGEVNLESLKSLSVKYTMIGQYGRIKFLDENKILIKDKLYKSLNCKFNTLLCVGEDKRTTRPFYKIKRQLIYYLKGVDKNKLKNLSIIYEPNYSMGSANINDVNYIVKNINRIKCFIKSKYNINIEVYYGGRITKENISQIINNCDGLVFGKTSTDLKVIKELLTKI